MNHNLIMNFASSTNLLAKRKIIEKQGYSNVDYTTNKPLSNREQKIII